MVSNTGLHGVGRGRVGGYVAPKTATAQLHVSAHFLPFLGQVPGCFWRLSSSSSLTPLWFVRKLETDEQPERSPLTFCTFSSFGRALVRPKRLPHRFGDV